MSEFKIGDKVKILSTNTVDGISNHGVEVGMFCEVVKHPNFKWRWWSFNYYDLELVED